MKSFFFLTALFVSSSFAQGLTTVLAENNPALFRSEKVYTVMDTFSGKPTYQIQVRRADTVIGNINVELFPLIAPMMVHVFDSLVAMKFFDTTAFHRVIPGFVIQGGDPNSRHGDTTTWGYGDPNQETVDAEFSAAKHLRGTLSMARTSDPNSATSQFFICVASRPDLDGKYTIFGRVASGIDIVDKIVNAPRNPNTDKPYVKIEMFVTKTGTNDSVPAAPVLAYPSNDTMNVKTSQRLTWSAVPSTVIYTVQVSKDSTFATVFYENNVGKPVDTVRNLEQNLVKYYWRVRTNNGGRLSPYSSVRHFTTMEALSVDDLSDVSSMTLEQNVPNPCSGLTVVSYQSSIASPATFEVRDMLGRVMYQTTVTASQQIPIDVSRFANGLYSYSLRSAGVSLTKRMIVVR